VSSRKSPKPAISSGLVGRKRSSRKVAKAPLSSGRVPVVIANMVLVRNKCSPMHPGCVHGSRSQCAFSLGKLPKKSIRHRHCKIQRIWVSPLPSTHLLKLYHIRCARGSGDPENVKQRFLRLHVAMGTSHDITSCFCNLAYSSKYLRRSCNCPTNFPSHA
jgi:hypothetical protein